MARIKKTSKILKSQSKAVRDCSISSHQIHVPQLKKAQSKHLALPLSVSLKVSSTDLLSRGRPSRKTRSKPPKTTTSDALLKRSKRTSSNKQSNLEELPLGVGTGASSAHVKKRSRPPGKTTSKTPITSNDTFKITLEPSKRSKRASLLSLSRIREESSTNLITAGRRKRTTEAASNVKGLRAITPALDTRSKRISRRNQNNLKDPPVSVSESPKSRSILIRNTSSETKLHPEIKAAKRGSPRIIKAFLERSKNKSRIIRTKTAKITSRKTQSETPSIPVPFKVSKRIALINEKKLSGTLSASAAFLKPRRKQSSITTRNKSTNKCLTSIRTSLNHQNDVDLKKSSFSGLLRNSFMQSRVNQSPKTVNQTTSARPKKEVTGTAINGSQVIQKTIKTEKGQAFLKTKPTKISKSSQNKKQNICSFRSPIYVDFQACDEISISNNGILETRMKKLDTSESLSTSSTSTLELTSASSCISSDQMLKIPKPLNPNRNTLVKRRASIRVSSLKPLICGRNTPLCKDRSDIQLAKESLHVSAIQETLLCRENEVKQICQIIERNILEKSGGCMYVSGVPGTGKTVSIATVIKSLQLQATAKNLPEFQFIEINGMRLTQPEHAYVHIYHQITGIKVSWEQACSLLETLFNTTSLERKTTVLVVDEFEKMKSQRDRVIFNLFDWTTKKSAQLFLVAIGNIINPSQLIKNALASRLGSTCIKFQPYKQNELQKIVQARLVGINIFDNEAIELVARKVASISGDCRRALDICRRAVEIGEKHCAGKEVFISTQHVSKAFDEMINNLKVIAIKGCSKYEKLFLQAVAAEVARTGVDETVLFQVYRQLEAICYLNGVSVPDPGIALRISSRLGSSRLLICEHSSASIHQKIMLNVTEDELRYTLDM